LVEWVECPDPEPGSSANFITSCFFVKKKSTYYPIIAIDAYKSKLHPGAIDIHITQCECCNNDYELDWGRTCVEYETWIKIESEEIKKRAIKIMEFMEEVK